MKANLRLSPSRNKPLHTTGLKCPKVRFLLMKPLLLWLMLVFPSVMTYAGESPADGQWHHAKGGRIREIAPPTATVTVNSVLADSREDLINVWYLLNHQLWDNVKLMEIAHKIVLLQAPLRVMINGNYGEIMQVTVIGQSSPMWVRSSTVVDIKFASEDR